ncbi:MAG: hypothetical protein K5798_01960 [Nitrosopumilus sp.]|nr:hypothetical protein [Nitrosopumilus sp.]MCV0366014.1 hypothetical protein [Nitrosopumilus sp.]
MIQQHATAVNTIYCSSNPCNGIPDRDIIIGTSSGEEINGDDGSIYNCVH